MSLKISIHFILLVENACTVPLLETPFAVQRVLLGRSDTESWHCDTTLSCTRHVIFPDELSGPVQGNDTDAATVNCLDKFVWPSPGTNTIEPDGC